MKKYFYVLMAFMALSLVACKDKNEPSDNEKTSSNTTGDNGGNGDISGAGVKNEFGEGRLIIGSWEQSTRKNRFNFYSDGTAEQVSYYKDHTTGYWSYNPETKLLATTMNGWSFTLNIMTNKVLQGISVGERNSYGFTRKHYVDKNSKLIIGKWVNEDSTKEYVFDGTNYTLTINGNKQTGSYEIQIIPGAYEYLNDGIITLGGTKYELGNLQGGYFSYHISGDSSTQEEFYYVSE